MKQKKKEIDLFNAMKKINSSNISITTKYILYFSTLLVYLSRLFIYYYLPTHNKMTSLSILINFLIDGTDEYIWGVHDHQNNKDKLNAKHFFIPLPRFPK